MSLYAIFSPALEGDVAAAFERTRALKQGFARWGFVFGPLWLLVNRMWTPLAIWIAGAAILEVAAQQGLLAPAAVGAVYWLAALAIGFEGREWQGAALTRAGRPLVDVIEARNAAEAETRFLARRLGDAPPPAAAPRDPSPRTPPRRPSGFPIIGMFPEAGR